MLVSACLLGEPVRYNGSCVTAALQALQQLQHHHQIYRLCPEVAAGLPIPRVAAEIQGRGGAAVLSEQGRIVGSDGSDQTASFVAGAQLALNLCLRENIGFAVLTEGSPSCGSKRIYDGSFTGQQIAGEGVVTALLRQHGVQVFSQHQINELLAVLK
ncbi:DUF523 domain-containing protein [Pseudoalteromonas fenneropenaei]|uniref:DUF523 domain-containing protein n=1 Tax=Pseudoalteromonas fenneropenaei TaxID=1737459 RepID=A0ABV7CIX4_9GAMM